MLTAVQSFFFTFVLYFQNNLYLYSLACAFGFLYSLIPTVIMIAAVLIRLLHTSPDMLYLFLKNAEKWIDIKNLDYLTAYFFTSKRPTLFEIIIGITVFFLARRFFGTVMQSVKRIFHEATDQRPLITHFITVAGEVLLVVITAVLVFVLTASKSFFYTLQADSVLSVPALLPFISTGLSELLPLLFNTVPYILIWIFTSLAFRFASGTKPRFKICVFAALLCSLIFAGVSYIFSLFIDTAKYNLIYGVLGNLMVMLLEVSVFFSLFLFFAQFVYVLQFFDSLLLAELYLLPARNETGFFQGIRRMLFIRPERFLYTVPMPKRKKRGKKKKPEAAHAEDVPVFETKKNGSIIFSKGDTDKAVYYLAAGSVELLRENNIAHLERGAFFGELSFLLSEPRNATARAVTDVQLIKISEKTFSELLNRSPEAVRKTISQISAYFARNTNLTENVHT